MDFLCYPHAGWQPLIRPAEPTRDALERMDPKFVALNDNPDTARRFAAWSRSRNRFQAQVAEKPPSSGSGQSQKRYHRGLDMDDRPGVPDPRAKPRLKPFVNGVPAETPGSTSINPDRLEKGDRRPDRLDEARQQL